MKNILIISDSDAENMANKIWKNNTEYAIITTDSIKDVIEDLLPFKQCIVIFRTYALQDIKPNKLISFIENNNLLPVFISYDANSLSNMIMNNISDVFQDSILLFENEREEDYDNLIKYCKTFMLKGTKNDKTLRASKRGKRKVTQT